MPRITPLRIVLLPVISYITLVFLFVTLPSPTAINWRNPGGYHRGVLISGKRLTTAYENNLKTYGSPRNVDNTERSWFAIDWQLIRDVAHDSVTLRVGTRSDFNVTKLAGVPHVPFISNVTTIAARPGDLDGVMLPWFDPVDASLMNWEIEKGQKILEIRVVISEPGQIQIWPEADIWKKQPLEIPENSETFKPFLTMYNVPLEGDKTTIFDIYVDDMSLHVPTRTFRLRRRILLTLKPITLVTISVLEDFIFPIARCLFVTIAMLIELGLVIASVGAGITGLYWWRAGRPPFETWAREFPLTRWKYRKSTKRTIWGPGGLIEQVDEDEFDHNSSVPGPRHLRSIMDFFRSRSPLDDLLYTFEATRWMTQSLGTPRERARPYHEPHGTITIRIAEEGKIKSGG